MKKLFLMMFLPLAMSLVSCDKNEDPIGGGGETPDVSVTYSAEVKSYHSVVLKGYAYGADGKVGFCYSAIDKNPNPEMNLYVETSSIQADDTYELIVDDLLPNTQYYYRAFATIDSKIVLAKEVKTFTTEEFRVEAVDLGLSVKWANCNVGANAPGEYGDYFAWGETEPYYTEGHSQDDPCENWKSGKSSYDWPSYKWCNGSKDTQTKYCTSSDFGTVDNRTVLEASDDAAAVNWGGSWRMPTIDELNELRYQCAWTWTTTLNGVDGYKVVGINGNSIFLPTAGYRVYYYLGSRFSFGYYWSSSLDSDDCSYACCMSFSRDHKWNNGDRYFGFSVRPVCE